MPPLDPLNNFSDFVAGLDLATALHPNPDAVTPTTGLAQVQQIMRRCERGTQPGDPIRITPANTMEMMNTMNRVMQEQSQVSRSAAAVMEQQRVAIENAERRLATMREAEQAAIRERDRARGEQLWHTEIMGAEFVDPRDRPRNNVEDRALRQREREYRDRYNPFDFNGALGPSAPVPNHPRTDRLRREDIGNIPQEIFGYPIFYERHDRFGDYTTVFTAKCEDRTAAINVSHQMLRQSAQGSIDLIRTVVEQLYQRLWRDINEKKIASQIAVERAWKQSTNRRPLLKRHTTRSLIFEGE